MTNFHDNPIETDGGMHNIRVMRNLMLNSASHAFCNQPSIGGPTYWIRNIAYHLPGGSRRLTGGSAGVLFYNNTILSETAARRRLEHALAQQPVPRRELGAGDLRRQHASRTTPRRTTTASVRIPVRAVSFAWNSPPPTRAADYTRADDAAAQGGAAAALETRQFADAGRLQHRRPGRIATACWWTTTCSSTCRRSTRRIAAKVQKVYKAEELDFG